MGVMAKISKNSTFTTLWFIAYTKTENTRDHVLEKTDPKLGFRCEVFWMLPVI